MAVIANRRSVMTLFSDATCPQSHRVRMVLAEKGITVEIVNIDPDNLPEDLIDLNPYQSVPTLVDRELVLYDPQVVTEYLDERFPHPPLMPVDPVSRARSRLALFRIEKDWYSLIRDLESKNDKLVTKARKTLRDSLASSAEVFSAKPYFLSDEFSLVDAAIAPVLWRLKYYNIDLPAQARAVNEYAERMFARDSFKASLTEAEKEMAE
ncbi:MAG: glutathione S-transferase N-terminal domain-containing protein [Thiogranum sp.]|jgi:RNA polymerase-associated protein|nr:glutathione S-transferase N-terminal domain-containing protein [Thiogranum sp.]